MQWDAFLLGSIGLYATVKLFLLYRILDRFKFLCLAIASSFFVIIQVGIIVNGLVSASHLSVYTSAVVEWGHILCLAFILSALTVFIRESKPVFAQFPMLYSALPLLIVLSHVLVTDTYAIKQWLISIYQGGAILVALLMYSVYSYRKDKYVPILGGTGLFLITFVLFWYVPGMKESYEWLWKLLLGLSMLTYVYGLESVHIGAKKPATVSSI